MEPAAYLPVICRQGREKNPMKASMLGLLVATTSFGGSSIYLWSQLHDERARADELAAKSAELGTRLADFEKARGTFEQHRFSADNSFGGGRAMVGPGEPPPPPGGEARPEAQISPWGVRPTPEHSAAMQKMMRTQLRVSNKRMYADVGSALALSKDETNKLIDLLTDQQVSHFGQHEFKDDDEMRRYSDEQGRKEESELVDLLGDEKAASLQEYQKSLPARQEVDMIARQLEGNEMPLTDDQRKRLVKTVAEELERVPAPAYVDGMDPDEQRKAQLAWEDDYNERLISQARTILNAEQASTFTEFQQAQKDMRTQFAAMTAPGGVHRPPGVAGRSMTFMNAMPVMTGPIVISEQTIVNAPPPPAE
jgi:hypothetical protein